MLSSFLFPIAFQTLHNVLPSSATDSISPISSVANRKPRTRAGYYEPNRRIYLGIVLYTHSEIGMNTPLTYVTVDTERPFPRKPFSRVCGNIRRALCTNSIVSSTRITKGTFRLRHNVVSAPPAFYKTSLAQLP